MTADCIEAGSSSRNKILDETSSQVVFRENGGGGGWEGRVLFQIYTSVLVSIWSVATISIFINFKSASKFITLSFSRKLIKFKSRLCIEKQTV